MGKIISKEPWWATPPRPGQQDSDLKWGWLIVEEGGVVRFDDSNRPSNEEIANRKACRVLEE